MKDLFSLQGIWSSALRIPPWTLWCLCRPLLVGLDIVSPVTAAGWVCWQMRWVRMCSTILAHAARNPTATYSRIRQKGHRDRPCLEPEASAAAAAATAASRPRMMTAECPRPPPPPLCSLLCLAEGEKQAWGKAYWSYYLDWTIPSKRRSTPETACWNTLTSTYCRHLRCKDVKVGHLMCSWIVQAIALTCVKTPFPYPNTSQAFRVQVVMKKWQEATWNSEHVHVCTHYLSLKVDAFHAEEFDVVCARKEG